MLDQQMKTVKQMIDMQKSTVDGMINSMTMFWTQTETMMETFLVQAVWIPEEGKKALRDWVETNKQGCETFRNAVNDGYSNLEKMFFQK